MTSNEPEHALARDIRKAARSVSFQWPGVISADDVEQQVWIVILESPATIEALREMSDTDRYRTVSKLGHRIASRERTDYDYFSGDFRYSVNEVKSLLESGALQNLKPTLKSAWSAEDYTAKGAQYEDTVLAKVSMETDLRRGMDELSKKASQYREVIERRYLYGLDVAAHYRLTRALSALTAQMNRSFKRQHADRPDGPGTRTAISNAEELSLTERCG